MSGQPAWSPGRWPKRWRKARAKWPLSAKCQRAAIFNLHADLAGTGVYAAHVAIAAFIGQGSPASEPAVLAEAYWRLHATRADAELVIDDLPADFRERGLADKFRTG